LSCVDVSVDYDHEINLFHLDIMDVSYSEMEVQLLVRHIKELTRKKTEYWRRYEPRSRIERIAKVEKMTIPVASEDLVHRLDYGLDD